MANDEIEAWHKEYKNRYFPMVYRRCFEILRNREDAEDAAQDVFDRFLSLKAEGRLDIRSEEPGGLFYSMGTFMGLNRLQKERKEICLFYAIATNVSLNRVREGVREKDMARGEIWDELENKDPSKLSDWKHLATQGNEDEIVLDLTIEDVLKEEDQKTRDIYIMRHRDRMTLREIGEVAGLSIPAVAKRLRKVETRINN